MDGYLGTRPVQAKPNGKNCLLCDESIVSVNQYAKFCSKKCRDKYYRLTKKQTQVHTSERECKVCGDSFRTKITNKIYCSQECINKNYQENILIKPYEITCKNCGNNYMGPKHKKYCSAECSYEYRYRKSKETWPAYNKQCIECGGHYSTTAKQSNYCSSECSRRYNNRRAEVNRRGQLKENGKIDWDISIERLIKRDGNECYLCNERCDLNDYVLRDDDTFVAGGSYPSIEHVMPVSKGGTHTWDNVKLAHRRCNTLKSDEIINA